MAHVILILSSIAVVLPLSFECRAYSYQNNLSWVPIKSLKSSGFKAHGQAHALNPFEKAPLLNSWVVTALTILGGAVLSLCSGAFASMFLVLSFYTN
jgi:hypothetical protein